MKEVFMGEGYECMHFHLQLTYLTTCVTLFSKQVRECAINCYNQVHFVSP